MVKRLFALIFSFIFTVSTCAFAGGGDDESTQKLLQRIEDLEKKVESLTEKLAVSEKAPAATISDEVIQRKVDDLLAKRETVEGGLVKALKDITLSGFVDTSYTINLDGPDSRMNTARVFDTESNNFNLHAGKVALEKLPPDEGGAGFRADLYFGEDAKLIRDFDSSTADDFEVEQAYVSLKPPPVCNLPFGCWEWIKVGKFVTMHGAEVIEAKDNWNFSRSILFGYAIPFTHTGIRAGYRIFEGLKGYFGVNNGWDQIKDNNKGKSVEGALAWAATDKLAFNLAGMYGPEQTSNDHSQRGLVDFLATYKPFDKWTLMLNADYAHEEDGVTAGEDASWSGVAGYVRFDPLSWLSLISRTEFFSDRQGLRVVSGTQQDLWEQTLTLELRPYKDLITRLEYRHDEASSPIFTDNQSATSHQDTIGLEMIYSF